MNVEIMHISKTAFSRSSLFQEQIIVMLSLFLFRGYQLWRLVKVILKRGDFDAVLTNSINSSLKGQKRTEIIHFLVNLNFTN